MTKSYLRRDIKGFDGAANEAELRSKIQLFAEVYFEGVGGEQIQAGDSWRARDFVKHIALPAAVAPLEKH